MLRNIRPRDRRAGGEEAFTAGTKLDKLRGIIRTSPKALVAFSGGVDSTLLVRLCRDVLGRRNVLAVTGVSQTYTKEEEETSARFAAELGVRHVRIRTDELKCREFAENAGDRCYHCKKELYGRIMALAASEGIPAVYDATNADDLGDYRPGRRAAEEFGVVSPFVQAGFTKADIRRLSKKLGLRTWDKPANPCLASRVPYGTRITPGILEKIRSGEEFIRGLGFPLVRLRHHGELARLEVPSSDFSRILKPALAGRITAHLRSLGYLWIALDVEGYRTGSLNRALQGPAAGGRPSRPGRKGRA